MAQHAGNVNPSLQFFGGFLPVRGLNNRQQALLGYLALHRASPVSRSELAFKLWADSTEEQALTNLRKTLHQLKQVGDFIQSDTRTLQIKTDIRIDLIDFAATLDSAEQARHASQTEAELSALETASAFYKGDLLPSLYDEWLIPERDRLRNLFIHAMDRLIALHETRKHYRDAIKHAQRLLQTDNLREETYRTLIRLHALNNDRAAALNVYHICAGILSKELNVEPDSSTRELYERLLKSDTQPIRVNIPARPIAAPLVAREHEWKQLTGAWKKASRGELRTVLLSGEAGIGKTRLAEELLHWAARQGIRALFAACYSAEGQTSLAPVVEWLRSMPLNGLEANQLAELSRLLPELRNETALPQPMTENWQRQIFFEALVRAFLVENQPLVLLLDDVQWCDSDTLAWLRYFLHFDKNAQILLLFTLRVEEIPTNNELQLLLLDLRAEDRLTDMELSRLDEKQTAELGSHLLGKNFTEADSLALFHESEGVPLFVVELANTGVRVDAARKTEAGSREKEAGLPPRLKAILEGRLARLSSPARAVIESAAVIGREFDYDLLRKISELEEGATVNALDEVWRLRMIRERGGRYDFSHDKLREATLAGISPIRLRWLHQRAGEALEANQITIEYARMADHFERAGQTMKASDYYIQAAAQARSAFAYVEALEHLKRGILLESNLMMQANLHESRGDMLKMLERREDAFQAYSQAHELSDDTLQKARLNRKQATLAGRFEIDTARQKYLATLAELDRAQHKDGYWHEWIETQLAWIEVCYWMQNAGEVNGLMAQIKIPIEQHGTLLQKIQYRFRLISSAFISERYRLTLEHVALAQETVEMAIESGVSHYISNAKRQFGMVAMCAGQLELAESAYRESISLAKQNGDQNSISIARTYLSLTHRRQRKAEEVRVDTDALEEHLKAVSDNPSYRGVISANRAWLAYLAGDFKQARHLAQSALDIWVALKNPYTLHYLALFVIFAITVQDENADEARVCAEAMLASPQWKLTREVESALQSTLEVDLKNKRQFLTRCKKAMEVAKIAGYL